ncbi:MAG: NusG domain II-containing protein [Clostridia bacterium]|nr:NusG domain II-containing protein [Clostridia bacterium]
MKKEKGSTELVSKFIESKPFHVKDLILYTFILCAVALLFVFFIILPKTDKPNGFSVSVNNEIVFTFEFSTEQITVLNENYQLSHDKNHNTITLYVDGNSYNKLSYNTNNLTVKIIDSNCPNHDCVDFFEISSGSGVIYCLPHGLKILPLVPIQSEPSTGGRL